jgi:P27 family predicted phage terminase small subunit
VATTKKSANRPAPPEDLEGEALLEWGRVCDELAAAGRLETADRAVLSVYVETWAVWRTATRHVNTFGPVVPGQNKVVGRSPFYTVQRETAAQLRNLLADMGLTPAARGKGAGTGADEPLDI